MSTTPTVSVVIPSYNRAGWLPAAVGSVLAQTHPATEILIVDDGSTDNSAEVCAAFPAPVRYIRQQNAGVSAARNRGMREATGEFIALLDSDDLWVPEKLAVQLALHAERPDLGWSATGALTIAPDDTIPAGRQGFERIFDVFNAEGVSAEQFFDRWFDRVPLEVSGKTYSAWAGDFYVPLFLGNFILPSSVLMRSDLVRKVGGFNEAFRLAEETEFFHRVAAEAPGQSGPIPSPAIGWGSASRWYRRPTWCRSSATRSRAASRRRGCGSHSAMRHGRPIRRDGAGCSWISPTPSFPCTTAPVHGPARPKPGATERAPCVRPASTLRRCCRRGCSRCCTG